MTYNTESSAAKKEFELQGAGNSTGKTGTDAERINVLLERQTGEA